MPCSCQQELVVEQKTGNKILIKYDPRSIGRHTVTGPATHESYGYRKKGDTFEVYEADMRVRPDLFKAVKPRNDRAKIVATRAEQVRARRTQIRERKEAQVAAQKAPEPPPAPEPIGDQNTGSMEEIELDKIPEGQKRLADLDWSGTRVNQSHIDLLVKDGVTCLDDLSSRNEASLLNINGIGPATVRVLMEKYSKLA